MEEKVKSDHPEEGDLHLAEEARPLEGPQQKKSQLRASTSPPPLHLSGAVFSFPLLPPPIVHLEWVGGGGWGDNVSGGHESSSEAPFPTQPSSPKQARLEQRE